MDNQDCFAPRPLATSESFKIIYDPGHPKIRIISGSDFFPNLLGSTIIAKKIAIITRVSVKPGIAKLPDIDKIILLNIQRAFTRNEWIFYQKEGNDAICNNNECLNKGGSYIFI